MDAHSALTAALQSDDRIRLAVIFGSAARGTSSTRSDVDGPAGPAIRGRSDGATQRRRTLMVRRDVAAARLTRATAWLTDAEQLFAVDENAFERATKDRDLALFYLFLALQECISRDLADRLREGVGLRNRIARGYALLDYKRVRSEALEGIPSLRAFLAAVGREAGV